MSEIVELTANYEQWLGGQLPLVAADLATKHAAMAASELRFLRGTYYFWLRRTGALLPETLRWATVPLVGDLHIENFGAWTDHRGLRRWGVNDFDELAWGSYAIDLIRLATSAVLAPGITLSDKAVCRLLLEHWRTATPGRATRLDGPAHRHLRRLVPKSQPAKAFYAQVAKAPPAIDAQPPAQVRTAASHSVDRHWTPTWHARSAGTGSLGHPRFAAVGRDQAGGMQAREVKLLGPPTVAWPNAGADLPIVDEDLFGRVHARIRGGYPARRVAGWQIRRLAPDAVRIDLSGLRPRDCERVLHSMAQAVVDVQGTDRASWQAAREQDAGLPAGWLREAVAVMVDDTRTAQRAWRAHYSS